jgi:hypothetical protein
MNAGSWVLIALAVAWTVLLLGAFAAIVAGARADARHHRAVERELRQTGTQRARAVNIARCPEHGLHGERTECFACGGPVEQIPMVPVDDAQQQERGT